MNYLILPNMLKSFFFVILIMNVFYGLGVGKSIQISLTCFILEFRYRAAGFSYSLCNSLIYYDLISAMFVFPCSQSFDSKFLKVYSELQPTPLQLEEDLEQLKVLENGYKMKVT